MRTTCECGMMLEQPTTRLTPCHECGTVRCRSCAIALDAVTYCRWCAISLAPSPGA